MFAYRIGLPRFVLLSRNIVALVLVLVGTAVPVSFVFVVAASASIAVVQRVYDLAQGRRDRSGGIDCKRCGRRAFPVEGTTTRYRCCMCACRFDGPGHWN
jgi:hypothetical protein